MHRRIRYQFECSRGETEPSMDAEAELIILGLRAEVERLREEIVRLKEHLDEAQRAAARSAAPFRRRESAKVPPDQKKRPGRPKGHKGEHRAVPERVDQHIDVPLEGCPKCGGVVRDVVACEQFIEEVPPVRPQVTRLVTYRGHCPACGDVASAHPMKMSEATGAAKVQLGPRAIALAAALNKKCGCTLRTTCRILHDLAGPRVTPGGVALALQRAGVKVEPSYDQLFAELRRGAAVFADETSWYVGDPKWWLWVFTAPATTAYVVDRERSSRVAAEALGADFGGILVSDCLAAYESLPYRKHKCIAHHLKAIARARERPDTPDQAHLDGWTRLFEAVIGFWRARPSMDEADFVACRRGLESWLDRLLAEPRTQPGDVSIQKRIGKRRGEVLGCLHDPAAEPTNNRAERALRPAVIARKLSCGNRTEAGKACFEVLTSLATTCAQRGHDFVAWLSEALPLLAQVRPVPARVATVPTR